MKLLTPIRPQALALVIRWSAALAVTAALASAHAAGSLPGTFWHSDGDLRDEGTFATDPNTGQSRKTSREKWGAPWPDGSRLLWRDYTSRGASGHQTRIVVRRSSDQAVLTDQVVDGYIGDDVRPSPLGGNQILMNWGESVRSNRGPVVYDLDARRLLYVTRPSKKPDSLSWMPDGSLLRASASGQISRVVLGGPETPVAALGWPENRLLHALHVSPDGSKVLLELATVGETGKLTGADLWVMGSGGTNLRRLTKNGLVSQAFWSPDSKYVAFVKDTGISCSDATCRGTCKLWVTDASASNVMAVKESNDAWQVPRRRLNGSMTTVGCPTMAWTR